MLSTSSKASLKVGTAPLGRLLTKEEVVERRIFLTRYIDVAFHEDALEKYPDKYEYLQKLFAHVEDADYVKRTLATHLYGQPLKRMYFWLGPPSGGKTTVFNVYSSVFRPYVVRPNEDILRKKETSSAGLSPQLASIMKPSRLAFMDEITVGRVESPQLKQLTGGELAYRGLYEAETTGQVTATLVIAFNDTKAPNVGMEDAGLQDRIRAVYFHEVPEGDRDTAYYALVDDEEFKQVVLRDLIEYTKQVELNSMDVPVAPPADTETVKKVTQEFIQAEGSPLSELCDVIRYTGNGGDALTSAMIWRVWTRLNNEADPRRDWVGGIHRSKLTGKVKAILKARGMPVEKVDSSDSRVSFEGRQVRGWRGWTIEGLPGETPLTLVNI